MEAPAAAAAKAIAKVVVKGDHDHFGASCKDVVDDQCVGGVTQSCVSGTNDRVPAAHQEVADGIDHVLVDEEGQILWR
jgi:hypothetical protein